MKSPLLAALVLAVAVLLPAGCSDTPTEPTVEPAAGRLVISFTQPCPLAGSVAALAGGTPLGTLVIPGNNTFSLPAGSYSLSFVRGQDTFGASGQVLVPAGGTVVVTDPPGACTSTAGAR